MLLFKRLIYIIVLLTGLTSCYTDETCRRDRKVSAGIGFYLDTINAQTRRLVVQKLNIDSLWLGGVGIDSLLYNNSKSVNSVKIPLNPFEPESRFRLVLNMVADTITIKHTNINHFISMECGYIRVYNINEVIATNHFIDSISVIHPTVNTTYVENIQIHHSK